MPKKNKDQTPKPIPIYDPFKTLRLGKSLSKLVAGDSETSLPVQRLLRESLEVSLWVGKASNHCFEILQDNTRHIAEVAGELQTGDKESSILFKVGIGVSHSKANIRSIERDKGVAVCSSDIVGELNLNRACGAAGRSCRDSKGEGGKSEGNGGTHFDRGMSYWFGFE